MSVQFRIAPDEAGRIDRAVARRYPQVGRRAIARMFNAGHVRVDDTVAKKGDVVRPGADVTLSFDPGADNSVLAADDATLAILHADDALVAINKPAGMPSHPLAPLELGTAANAIIARWPECGAASDDPREAGLVHRLDTHTSGVLIAARDADSWRKTRSQFSASLVEKRYIALVAARVNGSGTCSARLSRRGGRVRVVGEGMPALTEWRVLETLGNFTLLACTTHQGRRHQVRVHLASAGMPIAGDVQYGGPAVDGLDGQFLHASDVRLDHPIDHRSLNISAPLFPAQQALLQRLRVDERSEISVDEQEQ